MAAGDDVSLCGSAPSRACAPSPEGRTGPACGSLVHGRRGLQPEPSLWVSPASSDPFPSATGSACAHHRGEMRRGGWSSAGDAGSVHVPVFLQTIQNLKETRGLVIEWSPSRRFFASSRGKGPPVMRTPPASRRPRSGRPVSDTSGELWADPQIFPGRGLRASRPLL